jgi:tRNA(fMet)-specific endonuclease VapC
VNVLLDTNRLTDVLRGEPGVTTAVERSNVILIPFITLAEIRAGFLLGHRRRENEAALSRFLALPGVGIVFADRETTEVYARLFVYLRNAGTPIPTNDLWIASIAAQHHLLLLTRDTHFQKLPQILKG